MMLTVLHGILGKVRLRSSSGTMIRSLFAATCWIRLRSECFAFIWFDSEAAAISAARNGGQRLFCGMSSLRVPACLFGLDSCRSSRRPSP